MRRALLVSVLALGLALSGRTPARADTRVLKTKNSAGRSGSVYLPSDFAGHALPLMVAFHGTGGSGKDMIDEFSSLAGGEHEFIILAPDSRRSPSGELTWQVGLAADQATDDLKYTENCLAELKAMTDVVLDTSQVIAVGYSGGGSMAPYVASRLSAFTAFAVLHGGVLAGGLGSRRPRGWFSAGQDDSTRPAEQVHADRNSVASLFHPLEWKTFSGGHELSVEEKSALLSWWLP